ncbi:Uncharacterised protein [Mycobacterium tuberculosis]|nr:Uncharacterised protein [Mycobacterium tuberculosis]CPA31263.1 Uncharacterised protein [Mycobacterium tuberculosis]
MWPAHSVGAIVDQGVESGSRHGTEPLFDTVVVLNPAQVNGFRPAVNNDICGCLGILCGKPEFACVVVTSAGRNDS